MDKNLDLTTGSITKKNDYWEDTYIFSNIFQAFYSAIALVKLLTLWSNKIWRPTILKEQENRYSWFKNKFNCNSICCFNISAFCKTIIYAF
jgi:4-alpha-glucanotransferase